MSGPLNYAHLKTSLLTNHHQRNMTGHKRNRASTESIVKPHPALKPLSSSQAKQDNILQPSLLACLRRILPLAVVTVIPVALDGELWSKVWTGVRPRAWDGTGHYALAQIYDQSIFPDSYGWTNAYFAGMPFPNFYPPLFYWCVAFLHHSHVASFAIAFKLVLALSVILLPVAVWLLARVVLNNRMAATFAAFSIIPLLIDKRFYYPLGLSHASTFLVGLYTHPLGFVLLIAWYVVYLKVHHSRLRFVVGAALLALVILSNFFAAITAALFVAATVVHGLVILRIPTDEKERNDRRKALIAQFISPLLGVLLASFWLVPMLAGSDYFVTRPHAVPFNELVPAAMYAWYVLSIIGILCWLRRPTKAMWPFLATLCVLAIGILFDSVIAPRWFPLQSPRFLSTLNFLLAVPVGLALSEGWAKLIAAMLSGPMLWHQLAPNRLKRSRDRFSFRALTLIGVATVLAIGMLILLKPPSYGLAFFATTDSERIDGILRFAREHRNGRYMVEVPEFSRPGPSLDSRALNSYLGAQGNEALSVVFREASPNSVFFNPLVGALSAHPDNFGISSVLASDVDFVQQPIGQHLARLRFVGVQYLVIFSPAIKKQLAREQSVRSVHESGGWTVFELQGDPLPRIRALPFRPALVVTKLSLKLRRRDEYNFARLVEEQLADNWFDVLLVRSAESKIDRIEDLDQFGALILDTYECVDENLAYARLRDFASRRPLILLSSDEGLFRRVQAGIKDFPFAEIVEREPETSHEWLEATSPSSHYQSSSIRKEWRIIRQRLERQKIETGVAVTAVNGEIRQNAIHIDPARSHPGDSAPVLIETTFSPNWKREDRKTVYAATPFFIVTFINQQARLVYGRRWLDWVAMIVSVGALLFSTYWAKPWQLRL